jgi:hemerythrin-like domain-containing protein
MLRDRNLIPLSRQHQHALALCVRIDRASPIGEAELPPWQEELVQQFQSEIKVHFTAEEQVLFPVARSFSELIPLVEDLLTDHAALRASFALAEEQKMSPTDLLRFAERMSAHIRKEERQLFERMQELMNPDEMTRLGQGLETALAGAVQACALPANASQPRSRD